MNFRSPPLYLKTLAFIVVFSILVKAQGVSSHPSSSPSRPTVSAHATKSASGSYTELFLPTVIYDSGGQVASAFLLADVNGDQKTDIVVLNHLASQPNGDSQIAVLLGNGDGTFQPAAGFDAGSSGSTLAIGDVDGDGKLDLVVGNNGDSNGVSLLLGNGDGTFRPAVVYGTDTGSENGVVSVVIADLNGDKRGDVIALTSAGLSVLLGNADGTLQPALTFFPFEDFNLNALALADLNHDGTLDAITLSCYSFCIGGHADVWMGLGDGAFTGNTIIGPGGNASTPPLAVVDVNGDGIPDLVFGNGAAVSVAFGKGDGTFDPEQTYCLDCGGFESGASSMVVTDLNGDGKPDIAVVNYALTVFLNDGKGNFHQAFSYIPAQGGADATVVKSADFNKDGKPDLILLEPINSFVEVLLGNGDGTFSGGDLVFDAGGGSTDMAILDANADGRPDVLALNFCANTTTCSAGDQEGSLGVLLNNKNFVFGKTTTSVASSPNPSVYGQDVTFTAKAVPKKSGTPTGTVYFLRSDERGPFASANLVNGIATLTTAALPGGTISITAQYQGSENFGGSLSSPLNQTVQQATTTTTVVSSHNPLKVGQTVNYSASVQGQYGGQIGGNYTLFDGSTAIGIITFGGKKTSIKETYTTPGTHVITASYSGDAGNLPSMSAQFSEEVKAPTSTTLGTSGSPSYAGQPVTFTAVITSPYGTIPDGDLVNFYDGTTELGSVALVGGKAAYPTSSLSVKKHSIKATYVGDDNFEPSTAAVVQQVELYSSTTNFSSSPNPSTQGQVVMLTATVSSAAPGGTTGTVIFKNGTATVGTAKLSGGKATFTTTKLPVGTLTLSADYNGDTQSAKSSATTTQTVD
jgi:Bacterial Ig-like domain (group 3)/FG-GAP-like repeat